MSQRIAFLVSAALTAVILLAGVGLTARLMRNESTAADAGEAVAADGAADESQAQDQTYQEAFTRLQQANTALAASYDRIAGLLDRVDALQAQNAQLRAREVEYQDRLTEANRRLEGEGRAAVVLPGASRANVDESSAPGARADADEAREHE